MKPITPERRAEIVKLADSKRINGDTLAAQALNELLAAEDYWRTAVANAGELSQTHCEFCTAKGSQEFTHEDDCPWVLAQVQSRSAT